MPHFFWFILACALFVNVFAADGFHVIDGKLHDSTGAPFIMQGISHAHTWFKQSSIRAIPDIAQKGANVVRIVLSNGCRWSVDDARSVGELIQTCRQNKLIAILEVHDTTGYGEDPQACTLASAVQYWHDLQAVLAGQEAYVLINIGNEPVGGNNLTQWVDATRDAVVAMRAFGFRHTLLLDAPNWGQDWAGVMRRNAAAIFAADPLKNVVFCVHMYEMYPTASAVKGYLQFFADARLPLVVEEFANQHAGRPVAAQAIMALSTQMAGGYLGWSWSGNGGDDAPLDMVVRFDAAAPTSWGDMVFQDLARSRPCPVFG